MGVETRPLSPHIGLEILGVDLESPIDDATIRAIRDAWITGGILLFRRGGTSVEAHMRLSRVFGEMEPSATKDLNAGDNPYLLALTYDPAASSSIGATEYDLNGETRVGLIPWHWDQSFTPKIVRGAVLRMIDAPAHAGETGFIDAIGAYDRLPDTLKARIENLEVVYQFSGNNPDLSWFIASRVKIKKQVRSEAMEKRERSFPPTVHPLVITQRESGRKVLKLSPLHSQYVLGMDPDESLALLNELADYLTDERYAYYHRWQPNDLIVWDNWRVIHSAAGVRPDQRRAVERTTIVGDYELGRFLDPALDREKAKMVLMD